ncbi:hypothetical protein ACROYT_G028119 [Oculina patagonica]
MLVEKVPTFIVLIVLVATALSLSQASRVEIQRKNGHRWRCKTLVQPQPPPFFAGNRRPEGLPNITRGKEMQQTLPYDPNGTAPYFVSLFDPERNIPFYSAYKVTPQQAPFIGTYKRKDVRGDWRNPPGVPGLTDAYKKVCKEEPLSRGHMDPLAINSFDKSFMEATFTLTNAAPQYIASNSGPWQIFEAKVRRYAQNSCANRTRRGTLFLLTGTSDIGLEPYFYGKHAQDTKNFLGEVKLVIPRALFTAGCCLWNESSQVFGNVGRVESFAVMSNNVKDKKLLNQTEMSVAEVERHLTAPGSPPANLFPGKTSCRLPQNNIILQ